MAPWVELSVGLLSYSEWGLQSAKNASVSGAMQGVKSGAAARDGADGCHCQPYREIRGFGFTQI